jgi:hypothetical protein
VSHVLLARIHHKPRALKGAVDPWRIPSRSRVRDSGSRSAGRALGAVQSRCYTADDREVAAVTMEPFDDAIDVEIDVLGFDACPLPGAAVLQPATPPARRSAPRGRHALGPARTHVLTAPGAAGGHRVRQGAPPHDALSAMASAHQSDGLAGGTSSKNAVIIGSRTGTLAEIEM